jgi:hypothetical protein
VLHIYRASIISGRPGVDRVGFAAAALGGC